MVKSLLFVELKEYRAYTPEEKAAMKKENPNRPMLDHDRWFPSERPFDPDWPPRFANVVWWSSWTVSPGDGRTWNETEAIIVMENGHITTVGLSEIKAVKTDLE